MIAERMDIKVQSVLNKLHVIYLKLKVNSIVQASILAVNRNMLYTLNRLKKKNGKTHAIRKKRRKMTAKKLRIIQDKLNSSISVNTISEQVDVSEFTIRYWRKKGIFIRE